MKVVKVGDLVRYRYPSYNLENEIGLVLCDNVSKGGTVKVLTGSKGVQWFVSSYCEVINECGRPSEVQAS